MKERPILFSGPMVRAILDGRKTMTRRVVKNPDWLGCLSGDCPHESQTDCDASLAAECPYGVRGDRLWVREMFLPCRTAYAGCPIFEATYVCFRDGAQAYRDPMIDVIPWPGINPPNWTGHKFRPSIHMPRWASRITLEITAVRVERLQEITISDVRAEGFASTIDYGPALVEDFRTLWEKLNGQRGFGWDANPWVWVVSFRRVNA